MSYMCPKCHEDLDDWFDQNTPCSIYTGSFNCPSCKTELTCEHEEMWDGKEEYNLYWLEEKE